MDSAREVRMMVPIHEPLLEPDKRACAQRSTVGSPSSSLRSKSRAIEWPANRLFSGLDVGFIYDTLLSKIHRWRYLLSVLFNLILLIQIDLHITSVFKD